MVKTEEKKKHPRYQAREPPSLVGEDKNTDRTDLTRKPMTLKSLTPHDITSNNMASNLKD